MKRIRFDSNASDVVVIISLLSFNIAIIMSQILPSSRRLFRYESTTFVSTLGGRLTTMAKKTRARETFSNARIALLENVTPFFWVWCLGFLLTFFLSLCVESKPFSSLFFARDDDVQKRLRSARRQKIAKANRTAWKKLERHSRRIWTNSRTS